MSSRTSSTAAQSSTLRPRVPRLISGLSDGDPDTVSPAVRGLRRASPLPSPFDSREPSPMPAPYLSRTASAQTVRNARSINGLRSDRAQSPATLSAFFGDSWSALQGTVSELLTPSPATRSPAPSRRRKPSVNERPRTASNTPKQWGVPTTSTSSSIGAGSREERDALVRAEKRKQLMNATPEHLPDALGRYKRRSSEDGPSASAPPEHVNDRDALVYVHHVQLNDTLPGITLKYNIHPSALRRANRMWPNDRIQIRKTIFLPVDQCAVKGTRLNGSEDLYQLTQENNPFPTSIEEIKTPIATGRRRNESISTSGDRPPSSSCSLDAESTWVHDAWVLLPNNKQPTEIARLSRRNLAYFPPARRKSQSYSDVDTPSASFDLSRSVLHEHPAESPKEAPQRPRGTRRPSNATNGYFPSYLAGPGGVGTMGKNVKSPGPAQDGLNKMFASHLPNVAPPPNQSNLYLPDIPTYSDEPTPFTPGLTHAQAPSINIENVGAAVEGWMRKMAAKASTTREVGSVEQNPSIGGRSGIGDLIEMAESFEIGDDDEDDEEQYRGRQGSENNGRPVASSTSYASRTPAKDRSRSGVSARFGKNGKDD